MTCDPEKQNSPPTCHFLHPPTQVDSFPIDRTFEIESEGENGEESEDDQDASESEDPEDEEDCEIPDSEDSEDPDEEEEDEDEDPGEGGDGAAGGNDANAAGGAAGGKNYGKKFMLKCDELDIPMQSNNTKARLEALLEAAGE